MICGFLVLPSCFATFLPAVIMGHIAWSKAARDGGSRSRAKLGLIFGYGSLVLIPVIAAFAGLAAPLVIRQRQKADQMECMNHVRQIGIALEEYRTEHGTYPPELKMLDTEGITTNIDELLGLRAGNAGDWLYLPKADARKPDAHLLISPPIQKKHVVLQVSGAVLSVDEAKLPVESIARVAVLIPAPIKGAR